MSSTQHENIRPHRQEDNIMAEKTLPEAVLVYHESAHSIVFRDHLRRQLSAIRRTSTAMENSLHSSVHGSNHERTYSHSALDLENNGHGTQHVNIRHTISHPSEHDQPSHNSAKDRTRHTLAIYSEETPCTSTDSTPLASRATSTISNADTNETFQEVSCANKINLMSDTDVGYEPSGEAEFGYESSGSRESHGSRRSIDSVDHQKHQTNQFRNKKSMDSKYLLPVAVANFQPVVEPLQSLELTATDVFRPLLDADPMQLGDGILTDSEIEVVGLLRDERAVVKTVRNADWTSFMEKFSPRADEAIHEHHPAHRHRGDGPEIGHKLTEDGMGYPFNSFITSTSLLPSLGKKMRCFGSTNEYPIGVVFALPTAFPKDGSEEASAKRTKTWSWPSGYSAKTEFNIDRDGNLINGREEALVSLSGLRDMNNTYLHDTDYVVGGRMVHGGLTTVPYNEVYVRVGGVGRISLGIDVATGNNCDDTTDKGRTFDNGIGLPVALFVRQADYKSLVGIFRMRSRLSHIFGRDMAHGIPLLLITPELGVRVFTDTLQKHVLKTMALDLNPFQNSVLAHHCSVENTSQPFLKQKVEELLDLDDECLKSVLTPEEMARIAGGFGATDESVAHLLQQAMQRDIVEEESDGSHHTDSGHNLQDVVNEGLAFALRASDYHTARQLLLLYTLTASKRHNRGDRHRRIQSDNVNLSDRTSHNKNSREVEKGLHDSIHSSSSNVKLSANVLPPLPPPPPLDTDRLRSATNSDGLLSVLGAAQVLRSMQDGSAKRRVHEAIESIEEWIKNGEQSVAFRVASWRDQRAAQGDLKIAMESDSNFMAFISHKSIANRKKFADRLRDTVSVSDFDSLRFLHAIHNMISEMHSPCLRLELLQYILGIDNRYSVAHVKRSVELAATCLNISEAI